MRKRLLKGLTYFDWKMKSFSFNEGAIPNFHLSWGGGYIGFYIALTPKLRCYKFWT